MELIDLINRYKHDLSELNNNIKFNRITRECRLVLTQDLRHPTNYKFIQLNLENISSTNYATA